ncbi:DUF1203 domain-containing protein [uncultured Jatrophihabitans sp.]|uniref:DUF1203 domain-containing protein n=1 Tax=uncultured Jatrophihabitans sp. TaxID=1610747 RepID=UPI0035CBC93D
MTLVKPQTHLHVQAIDTGHLDQVRTSGTDGHGNRVRPFAAAGGGGEPLRCCLRYAREGEQIALISYAPLDHPSVWREVGPVYIHVAPCGGYRSAGLPEELATGPRVLRTYRADATMNYDHNTLVADDADLTPIIERLLAEPDVDTVHVRTVVPQCFLYSVTTR